MMDQIVVNTSDIFVWCMIGFFAILTLITLIMFIIEVIQTEKFIKYVDDNDVWVPLGFELDGDWKTYKNRIK
jgi:hypothetical protein